MNNQSIVKGKYRPEIDGLRAFAVIAVIINHFNKNFLSSGYLGVDIFFVISGYVITSSFSLKTSANLKDLIIGFYIRRIKRNYRMVYKIKVKGYEFLSKVLEHDIENDYRETEDKNKEQAPITKKS